MAHRRFGAFYARSFERRPWVTLAVANGTLGAIADTLAQTLERYQRRQASSSILPSSGGNGKIGEVEKQLSTGVQEGLSKPWDGARTARFFAFGVLMAPLLAEWNKFIEFRFPLRAASAATSAGKVSLVALAKRVTVDQGLL